MNSFVGFVVGIALLAISVGDYIRSEKIAALEARIVVLEAKP